jgi:hypothetical protein
MRSSARISRRLVLGGVVGASLAAAAHAQSQSRKPKPPPGRDPGGVAVAIVGDGVNYLRPEIASRLARDGEGDLIGFDLGDNDARPIERDPPPSATAPIGRHTGLAQLVLREAGASRLVVARRKPKDPDGLAKAVGFAGVTPARVVLLLPEGPGENWDLLRQAAAYFRRHLLVMPAGFTQGPAGRLGANLIVVAGLAGEGSPEQRVGADVAVSSTLDGGADVTPPGSGTAAARVAALAARLLAVEPQLEGAALKARIVGLAQPVAGAAVSEPRVITEPQRHFQ